MISKDFWIIVSDHFCVGDVFGNFYFCNMRDHFSFFMYIILLIFIGRDIAKNDQY